MFGLLGDADASSDSATSDIISTIGNNITDTLSQAASSASEFFPNLVHGSLRALQYNDDYYGSASGSGSGGGSATDNSDGGELTAGEIGAIVALVIIVGCCAGLISWCKAALCGDANLGGVAVRNPMHRRVVEEWRTVEMPVADPNRFNSPLANHPGSFYTS